MFSNSTPYRLVYRLSPVSLRIQTIRGSRRVLKPPQHVIKKEESYRHENLTKENAEFLLETARSKVYSPLKEEPWERGVWTETSKRTGLIAQKIGVCPQWLTDGTRILTTLLHICDNHVVGYTDADTWYRDSLIGRRKAFNRFGRMSKLTIGAVNADPNKMTKAYRGLFDVKGLQPKQRLASFAITDNAKIQPGAQLFVSHFKVGQWVDCTGKSIDWGFQGVMHRWGFKGNRGADTTKAHRRPGSIGSTGDAKVQPLKRLPGHMGYEWRHTRGVRVVRINHKEQVIYVRGPGIPGDVGEFILIKDSWIEKKCIQNPPFPTHFREEDTEPLPDEEFLDELFQFTSASLDFPEPEPLTSRLKIGKKQAKIRTKS